MGDKILFSLDGFPCPFLKNTDFIRISTPVGYFSSSVPRVANTCQVVATAKKTPH